MTVRTRSDGVNTALASSMQQAAPCSTLEKAVNRNNAALEALLRENEGPTLDFKQEQYRCTSKDDKGELIKDILAFTNAWRRTDAYILTGVKENLGGRAQILGVTHHLSDADLQQLVNSKTNGPITFSYKAEQLDGKDIGVIHIPVQKRPRFIVKPFGKLSANTVYIRRSSSTAIALPDEVAEMGSASLGGISPDLGVQFANISKRIKSGTSITIEGTYVAIPDVKSIPDFEQQGSVVDHGNRNYLRNLASYEWLHLLCSRVEFAITNSGSVTATDVLVELNLHSSDAIALDEYDWPKKPQKYRPIGVTDTLPLVRGKDSDDIQVENLNDGRYIIKITTRKIQPKQTIWIAASLYIGSKSSGDIALDGAIWADNISTPKSVELEVRFVTDRHSMEWKKFLEDREKESVSKLLRDSLQ